MAETVSPELHTPVADRVSAVPDILVALREATALIAMARPIPETGEDHDA